MCVRVGRQGTHYVDVFTVVLHVVLHLQHYLLLLLAQSCLMKKS